MSKRNTQVGDVGMPEPKVRPSEEGPIHWLEGMCGPDRFGNALPMPNYYTGLGISGLTYILFVGTQYILWSRGNTWSLPGFTSVRILDGTDSLKAVMRRCEEFEESLHLGERA